MAQANAHHKSEPRDNSTDRPTRRTLLHAAAAVPVAAIAPMAAIAASPADADLIALGKKYEPLLRQLLDAHVEWAPLLNGAHRRASELSGVDPLAKDTRGYRRMFAIGIGRCWIRFAPRALTVRAMHTCRRSTL